MSLSFRSNSSSKYSSGVMAVGLLAVAHSVVRSCWGQNSVRMPQPLPDPVSEVGGHAKQLWNSKFLAVPFVN